MAQRSWLSLVIACGLAFSVPVATAEARPAIIVRSATFAALPRVWEALPTTADLLGRAGAETESVALSWHYRPNSYGWANSMPRNGIAVNVLLLRKSPGTFQTNLCRNTPHLAGYPKIRHLPLELPTNTMSQLEGVSKVREYRLFGRIDESYNVELRVDVNNPHPNPALLRRAQSVVNHIRFPTWPRVKHC